MLRWTLYPHRRLANLLGDPMEATRCQVCYGKGRIDGDWCPTCQGKMWILPASSRTACRRSDQWRGSVRANSGRCWPPPKKHHELSQGTVDYGVRRGLKFLSFARRCRGEIETQRTTVPRACTSQPKAWHLAKEGRLRATATGPVLVE